MSAQSVGPINGQPQQPQQVQPAQQSQNTPEVKTKPVEISPKLAPVEVISEATKAMSEEATKKHIEDLNKLLSSRNTNVTLEYDSLSSPQKVSIIDAESGKLLRQLPATAALEIAEKARDYVLGLMFDKKI